MKQLSRKAVQVAGPILLKLVQKLLSGRSPEDTEKAGERLASIWWSVERKRRNKACSNLALAFPEWSPEQRRQVARAVFTHFGRITADFLSAQKWTIEQLEATTEVEGWEHVEAGFAKGKGVMFITGHLGNWERISALLSMKGFKVSVVARDADQADVNMFVNNLREAPGTQVIAKGNAARPILERLRANEAVGILPDQNAKEVFVPFFNHPAGCVLGPGVLAERTGCTVVPAACLRVGVGRYRIRFYPELKPVPAPPGQEEVKRGEGYMRAINLWLEGVIREAPEQWLWIHDRWRSARKRGLIPQ